MAEKLKVETVFQVRKIKVGLQRHFPQLLSQIINILLFRKEEALACYLTAFYKIAINQQLLQYAVNQECYNWLMYMWAFKQNFYDETKKKPKQEGLEKTLKTDGLPDNLITFKDLFGQIKKKERDNVEKDRITKEIKICCLWMIDSDDNILSALLYHQEDQLALAFLGDYSKFRNQDLFLFSLEKNSQEFIKQSLIMGAFDKDTFKKEEVVEKILEYFTIGSKTIFLLNTMILTDVSVWNVKQIEQLINMLSDFVSDDFQDNRLLLSYNPMMSIALTAELLEKIANSRGKFQNKCQVIKQEILELGKVYNEKIQDIDYFKLLIMDKDFQNRTVLKIITERGFEALMSQDDPKAENIMNSVYIGQEATKCDGMILGYSNFMHILTSKPTKITDNSKSFLEMIQIDFLPQLQKVDYIFQHRYRKRSIKTFFMKELFFAIVLCSFSLAIFDDYQTQFRGQDVYFTLQEKVVGDEVVKEWSVCNTDACYGTSMAQFTNISPRREMD